VLLSVVTTSFLLFQHYGVFVKSGYGFRQIRQLLVVHFSDQCGGEPELREDDLQTIANGDRCRLNNALDGKQGIRVRPAREVVEEARRRVGISNPFYSCFDVF
jgi:hypothetical protein